MPAEATTIHATAIAIDGAGVLFRGPSGAGKSRLACDMLYHAGEAGRDARLVGDDRVALAVSDGRLTARGHPAIRGRIECRGLGILHFPVADEAPLRWIVEISGTGERLPEPAVQPTRILGCEVPTYLVSSSKVAATALLTLLFGGAALLHQDES
jgi:HPr kinase/phosphorylase